MSSLILPALGLLLVVVAAVYALRSQPPTRAPSAPAPLRRPAAGPERPAEAPPPSLAALPTLPPPEPLRAESSAVSEADRELYGELLQRLNSRSTASDDPQAAEGLYTRHPSQPQIRDLLEAVLLAAAVEERGQRRLDRALELLSRAEQLPGRRSQTLSLLMDVLLESGDWAAAEAAARELLALDRRRAETWRSLGYALMRQDRNQEALEALQASLELHEDAGTRALLDRLRRGLASEKGMTEQRLAHFHVRYDGEEHEDVGREILRALERHYATLIRTFDHQPTATIPVILFSSRSYYDSTGAPAWSGGHYDSFDGRVRMPIGGLTGALTPELDGALMHELTHAFVADRSRGVAPREIHEGLAQYAEGKRVTTMLTADQVRALAEQRLGGVGGFYVAALSFVEYLMAQRGQGGINDLLQAMGETGEVNEAFRRVYGQEYRSAMQAWATRLRHEHGS